MKNLKKIFCFVLSLFMLASYFSFTAFAESMKSITEIDIASYSKIRFKGETNKDFTKYEIGEEIVFTMTLWGDDEQLSAPYFKCTLTGDDGQSSVNFYDASSGSVNISTSLSRAGAVRLVVEPCDDAKNVISADNITVFEGGALAGAGDVRTTVAEPLDFDEYWEGKLAELDECEPNLLSLEPIASNDPNFDAYIVKVDCIGDPDMVATNATWVCGVLSVPKNAAKGSLGLQLEFQGYGVNSTWQTNHDWNVTFSVSAHSIEQLKDNAYYWNTEALGLSNYGWSTVENADPDTSYYSHMLMRDVQAYRFLKKYFGTEGGEESFGGVDISSWKGLWRGDFLQTNGGSQGGFQAIAVAALVPEVTHVAASVPWMADVASGLDPLKIQTTFRPPYADGLRYFDTSFMAKRVKAGTVWLYGGTGDTICPMYGVQTVYNSFNTNVSFNFDQGMGHSATNTIPITSNQSKSYSEDYSLGSDAIVIKNMPSESFSSDFAAEWKALNGRNAVIYSDIPTEFDEEDLFVIYFVDSKASLASLMDMIDNFAMNEIGVAFLGDTTEYFGEDVRTILAAAADPDTKIHLLSYGEGITDAGTVAENASGAIYGNQVTDSGKYKVIDGSGSLCSAFSVESGNSVEIYPVSYPYCTTKNSALSAKTNDGMITVTGKHGSKEIKIISSSSVQDFGHTANVEWTIKGSTMTLYGDVIGGCGKKWNDEMSGITEIVISDGAKKLASGAIDAPKGTVITLPLSIKLIHKNAFCGNNEIKLSAYEDTITEKFAKENGLDFVSLGALNTCGSKVYWTYSDGVLTIFGSGSTIVSGVTSWGPEAAKSSVWYEHYNDIEKVVIGGEINRIGVRAFHFMNNLTTVEISPNVKYIDQAAFENCGSLSTIYVSGNEPVAGVADLGGIVELQGGYQFDGTPAIKSYIFSDAFTGNIGTETFKANTIEEFTAPKNTSSIDALSFSETSTLKTLIVPGKNTVISKYAFANAGGGSATTDHIKNITIVSYSDSLAHQFAKVNKLKFKDIETDELTDYATVDVNDLVISGHIVESWMGSTTVDNTWTFEYKTGILTVTSNVGSGWNECGNIYSNGSWNEILKDIKEVALVGNISKISGNAFRGAVNLTKVTIPAQIGQINGSAFEGCEKLTTITVEGEPEMKNVVNFYNINGHGNCLADGSNIFAGVKNVTALVLGSVYSDEYPLAEANIPENLKTIYGNTAYLKRYCEKNGLEFIPFGKASEASIYWTIDESTDEMTLFGGGALNGLDESIDAYASSVKSVIIDKRITELGDGALAKLDSLECVSFLGDAPLVAPNAKPFGKQSSEFVVNAKSNANGFDGDTWCGYTLIKPPFMAGDINDDGDVNVADAVLLAQYLAKWDVELVGPSVPLPDPDPEPEPNPDDDLEDNEVDADIVV